MKIITLFIVLENKIKNIFCKFAKFVKYQNNFQLIFFIKIKVLKFMKNEL